ncbi:MAG: hypothetical protein Q8L59_01830 [Phenylobacterium sp.]|jgi:hypothetical protein|uniref:hypothetical protein n=1 Tax=Phenylobacterium sp. TaxID=1871053 RepID=UPI002732E13B|nr:hypothetical protein [Phenylobacterium sp.]MBW0150888.1 hypothetical protein [Phenylobacterium sp.]MDP1640900.1 hypothetical protein [Phenylobacterium sp.]MDP3118303.1 hypothetical protein [Phenylobacterium sp.]MDP3299487.1 hypothetical protein [Phenylobacterium sp.]MDP3384285.1 hypothetical protein [Phenylobacterium sp.]
MHLDEGHETAHPPRRRHLLQRFEGATDLMVVALIVLLGGAMLFGLLTAGGSPTYMR